MSDEIFEQTFQVSGPAHLTVKNICGSVQVHPGEDGIIQVTATKRTHTGDEKHTEVEIKQESDGTVVAVVRFPDGGWNWLFGSRPCDVDFVVKAPRQCSLKLSGVSNSVETAGFEGSVSINTVSGEMTLRDLTGDMRIKAVSGDAEGENLSGSLDLETVSGDVAFNKSTLSSVKANTVSGDMRLHTALAEGPYSFKSVSGNVRLIVPPETRCTSELHSVSGDIVSAFPVTSFSRHHGSQTINVQGGGVKIYLNSVSGDLSLECNGEIPQSADTAKNTSKEDRRAVLEKLEHGELTVEEALGKLNS